MYNWFYYDLLSLALLIVRYGASSLLCLKYTRSFLKERHDSRAVFAVWNILYILGAVTLYFAFNTVNALQNILCIAAKIVFLLILQRLLFYKGGALNLFTVFSFIAGRDLIISVISVAVYHILGEIPVNTLLWLSERAGADSEQFLLDHGFALLFLFDAIITVIATIGFISLFALYLKIIKKSFRKKDYRLQKKESVFLILPLAASLCISITVRMMEFTENNEIYSDIFEVVPVTVFFIPLIDILLLGTNIASVVLFQSLVEYNEEKSKRDLLESQITRMREEITEIQDIYSDIRGLRHDMKNHIGNLSLYLKRKGGGDKLLSEYIGNMEKTVDRLDFSYSTGDPICDVIIHRKSGEAEKKGIRFKSDFVFPKARKIVMQAQKNDLKTDTADSEQAADKTYAVDPYDIGVILSNSLENSVEACEKAGEGAYIYLRSYVKGSLFFIETENSFTGELKYGGSGLPLSSKESRGHGYGLSNIERTAKKYMGGIDIAAEERNGRGVFFLTVMLHL